MPTRNSASLRTSLDPLLADCGVQFNSCPSPFVISAFEAGTSNRHYFVRPCKRWSCEACCRVKAWTMGLRVNLAKPTKFLTLTCRRTDTMTARQAFDSTRRAVSELAKTIRLSHDEFEFFRVLENTKAGWPHYHLLCRCDFLPHSMLRSRWKELTGNNILHIEKIHDGPRAQDYVFKYICKQTVIEYTSRRLSWSRHFFPDKEPTEKHESNLHGWTRHGTSGLFSLSYELATHRHERISANHFIVVQHDLGIWTDIIPATP